MRTRYLNENYSSLIALTDSKVVWGWSALLIAVLLLLPMLLGSYAMSLSTRILIAVIGAVGLNLLNGTTGLVSIGQSGFLAVGAYTNALLISDFGWPSELSIPMAGIMAAAFSLLVGIPSLRLRGLYLAITTMAFAFIVNHAILSATKLTHGTKGVFLPEKVTFFGIQLISDNGLYYVTLGICILLVLVALNLLRSRIGRAWMAIRENDIAARVMGVNLVTYKLLAFMASSFFVGIAGAMMSLQYQFINTDIFTLLLSIEALAMIILGGMASVAGAIIGAVFLTILPEVIRFGVGLLREDLLDMFSKYIFEVRAMLYGIIIVVVLRFEPDGMIGIWNRVKKYWTNWPVALK